jgi:chemotaxis protein MotB
MQRLTILTVSLFFFSCVSSKKYSDLRQKNEECNKSVDRLTTENRALTTSQTELNARLEKLRKELAEAEADTARLFSEKESLLAEKRSLKSDYEELSGRYEKMAAGSSQESARLIADLKNTQEQLQQREDRLQKLESELKVKEQRLASAGQELEKREHRVKELEGILSRKDSAVTALKNAVSNALVGFKESGLTVEQRNSKVYVSLEERLLFASGSVTVEKKGEEALKQLAKVLEKKPDIHVLIEGHTDDVPISGGPYKDNWDLSVMRATSIVRILTSGSRINPAQLTAAGRGEHVPVDPARTPEARRKNRRTEIILSPKLEELFKVLDSN